MIARGGHGMSNIEFSQEPAYWTGEVAKGLEISDSTLRKWCIQLEANGYRFIKGENESRAFTEHDLMALKYFKQLVKVDRATKEIASQKVVQRYGERGGTAPMQAIEKGVQLQSLQEKINDMAESLETIKKQLDEQMEFNKKLVERMDQQSMNYVREVQETRKQLATAAEPKKKWWRFW